MQSKEGGEGKQKEYVLAHQGEKSLEGRKEGGISPRGKRGEKGFPRKSSSSRRKRENRGFFTTIGKAKVH